MPRDEMNQRRQIRERAVRHRPGIGVDVLAEQGDFAHSLRRQALAPPSSTCSKGRLISSPRV